MDIKELRARIDELPSGGSEQAAYVHDLLNVAEAAQVLMSFRCRCAYCCDNDPEIPAAFNALTTALARLEGA